MTWAGAKRTFFWVWVTATVIVVVPIGMAVLWDSPEARTATLWAAFALCMAYGARYAIEDCVRRVVAREFERMHEHLAATRREISKIREDLARK